MILERKNYLFCGNDASTYWATIVYSLIATCKSAGVEPRTRIEDILHKIPYYERDEKDMTELLSSNWVKSNQTCSE
ncbi:transposase domain-containing protein [Bacteroides finegoldii]|uniref:transposase domain-containing protein n=1 Tax=Bacteroides finegoldii TaxID=338188 RepID=UPI00189F7E36